MTNLRFETTATDDSLPAEVLKQFGCLGGRITVLAGGVMTRNWRVDGSRGSLVLRAHGRFRSEGAIAWEHALIRFAGERGWPVAAPVEIGPRTTVFAHQERLWSAAPFLPGLPGAADRAGMHAIYGRLLARLHNDLAEFPVEGQRPDFGKTWELDIMVRPAEAGSFNELVAAFGGEYPELAARIRRERYRNLRELSRLHYPDLPDRVIHGDFLPRNLLLDGGQLTAVLDFDQARRDALACDIAPLLMPFQPLAPRLRRAFVEGYESVRPLTDGEWKLLPALVRAALLWWVAFLLVRWRLDGGEPGGIARTMNERFPAWDAAGIGAGR